MAPMRNTNNNDLFDAWRGEINSSLKEQSHTMQELLVEVRQRPTRPEIEMMLATKVSLDLFNAELKGLRDDIAELRQRPESFRGWIGAGVALVSLAVSIILILAQHWH